MVRCFIAVDVDKSALSPNLGMVLRPLEQQGVRIIPPENYHVTLYFLGDISPSNVDQLIEELKTVQFKPFTMQLGSFETFPPLTKRSNRYVLHLSVKRGVQELQELHRQVVDVVTRLGFPKESRPFTPHLTLARIKYPKPPVITALRHVLDLDDEDLSFPEITVKAFQLKKSTLTPRGAIYEDIQAFYSQKA